MNPSTTNAFETHKFHKKIKKMIIKISSWKTNKAHCSTTFSNFYQLPIFKLLFVGLYCRYGNSKSTISIVSGLNCVSSYRILAIWNFDRPEECKKSNSQSYSICLAITNLGTVLGLIS